MDLLNKYQLNIDETSVKQSVANILNNLNYFKSKEILKNIFNLIDLTSLNVTDTFTEIYETTEKVNHFTEKFPEMPNVAAICVYPALVPVVKKYLTAEKVGIASVAAGFPASQTFTDIKILECKRAVIEGATEIDTVIPVGQFFEGNYEKVFNEIKAEKECIGNAHLKIILETGCLRSFKEVRIASLLALEAGADFLKTSTGKTAPAATPEAVFIMCQAIKEYQSISNRKVGIKPAGGILTPSDAIVYYAIVKETLGEEWLNNNLFRIGASKLANNILTEITAIDNIKTEPIIYF